jgi:hypothetical protein
MEEKTHEIEKGSPVAIDTPETNVPENNDSETNFLKTNDLEKNIPTSKKQGKKQDEKKI